MCYRDLRYSTFCVSHITAKIWFDTILYYDIHGKNNVTLFIAVVEYITDKLIRKLLYYNVDCVYVPLQHSRMSHKTCIAQHYIATLILRYSWSTVSQYDIQSLYRYIAVSICIEYPYSVIYVVIIHRVSVMTVHLPLRNQDGDAAC